MEISNTVKRLILINLKLKYTKQKIYILIEKILTKNKPKES